MEEEALYRLALIRTTGIGTVQTKKLIHIFGDARAIFQASKKSLSHAGLTEDIVKSILGFCARTDLEAEMRQLADKDIKQLFFTDEHYPRRVLSVPDAPPLLFYRADG